MLELGRDLKEVLLKVIKENKAKLIAKIIRLGIDTNTEYEQGLLQTFQLKISVIESISF